MLGSFASRTFTVVPPARLRTVVLAWAVAEIVVFALAVKLFGLGGALLLTMVTSAVGIIRLRRAGLEAVQSLRGAAMGAAAGDGRVLEGTLSAVGALLLILPGFVSDVVGLALASPSMRQHVVKLFGFGTAARRPDVARAFRQPARRDDVIDLSPEDWRVVDKPARR